MDDSSPLSGQARTGEARATYTPAPWEWTWDGEGQPGRVAVVLPVEPVEDCGYSSHCIALTQPGKFDAKANARRIVACVNACAGMRTETLEVAAAGGPRVREWFDAWCEQGNQQMYAPASPPLSPGWRCVPIEPTPEMLAAVLPAFNRMNAMNDALGLSRMPLNDAGVYRAMVEAAPAPPKGDTP